MAAATALVGALLTLALALGGHNAPVAHADTPATSPTVTATDSSASDTPSPAPTDSATSSPTAGTIQLDITAWD